MLWRNLLYFTKKERVGILLLLACILLAVVWKEKKGSVLRTKSLVEQDSLTQSVFAQIDSTQQQKHQAKQRYYPKANPPIKVVLQRFNPNTIDSTGLLSLGLPPYVARNILKYRAKGGRFKKPEDFSKIYGLSQEQFLQLLPYIYLPQEVPTQPAANLPATIATREPVSSRAKTDSVHPNISSSSFKKQEKHPLGTVLDLNQADTTELKKIPGIGSAFAKRITKYRELLGGFYSTWQLQEVYGMSEELCHDLQAWFSVNPQAVRTLPVQTLSLEKLKAHPYINFYQAKAIIELRKKKNLGSLSDLQLLEEFSEEDLFRLKPYLSFE